MLRKNIMFHKTMSPLKLSRLLLVLLLALVLGALIPTVTYAAGPNPQTAPIEGSIFPALLQVALIVLVTEGVKSLARALGNVTIEGKAAAVAYVVVGIGVYALQTFVLPALPVGVAEQLGQFLAAVAVIVGGSGLFSMTSALRVKSVPLSPALEAWVEPVGSVANSLTRDAYPRDAFPRK